MEITYLIGNGFDIACGLKTQYSDFLTYYINYPNSEPVIAEFKSYITDDLESWADAELALGKVTQQYTSRSLDFQKCYDDFIFHLSSYLETQEQSVSDKLIERIASRKFSDGIIGFFNKFSADEKESIIEHIKKIPIISLDFNFIIFNYTNVFEKLLTHLLDRENQIGYTNNAAFKKSFFAKLKEIEYVHSNIENLPLILGVNDGSQILNSTLQYDFDLISSLVKPESNAAIRKSVVYRCTEIIDRSNIICVFGMSIGATDKFWWDYIHNWLINDSQNMLLIFWWDPVCIKSSVGSCISARKRFEQSLWKKMNFSDTEIEMVRDRVHVAINSNPFGF